MGSRTPRKIIIVGGVAGGMSAATRLRRLDEDASITVFEKGPYVSFANCGIPYALSDVIPDRGSLLLQTPEGFKKRFNVDVHVNHEVVGIDPAKHTVRVRPAGNPADAREVAYDKLILAQGAAPTELKIPGATEPHVFHLTTIDDLHGANGYMASHPVKTACVIGGGFIGLEAAENLRLRGLDVTLLELAPQVLAPYDADVVEPIHAELRRNGIALHLSTAASSILPSHVVTSSGATHPADLILVALGVRPRTSLASAAGLAISAKTGGVVVTPHMQTSDPDIYAVGDMVESPGPEPRLALLAGPANRQGRIAADHIAGCNPSGGYRGSVGTAAVKVFSLTAGIVGHSVAALRKAGKDPLWVSAHPPDHAGYYPGAKPVSVKVIFERSTGRLLGAQAVGAAGVDKRIDVLATALQAGWAVTDLEHLELAYAPPYGSAKDVVNMAGFIGGNVLRGDVVVVHSDELTEEKLSGYQVVDVRGPGELKGGFVKGAVNIPINTLRENLDELDKTKKTLVYCQVGYRGYLAYRILKQRGFGDVANLDGGFKTVTQAGLRALQEMSKD